MYPGKFLSLANKGWDWAPLLKHVGFEWKKSELHVKKRENYKKSWRIFGASKLNYEDQKIKIPRNPKKLKIPENQTIKVVNSKRSKIKLSRKWRIQRIS